MAVIGTPQVTKSDDVAQLHYDTVPAPADCEAPASATGCVDLCPDTAIRTDCTWIFDRLRVWPLIAGGSRVEWVIHPQFNENEPYTFQLQMGRTGNNDADDWCDVGLPADDVCFALDPTQRVYGKTQWTHYRVKLTTADGNSYTSEPQHSLGALDQRDWSRVREITRREDLRLRKESGQEGYLLKRKLFGTECSCLDTQTKEVRNANCDQCYGTGFVGGYYAPYADFWVELQPHGHRSQVDDSRGTIDDVARTAGRMLNTPQVFSYDVWVDKDTDMRWIIHTIKHAVEIRGVPVVLYPVELRLAPYTHPVYNIAMPNQVPS